MSLQQDHGGVNRKCSPRRSLIFNVGFLTFVGSIHLHGRASGPGFPGIHSYIKATRGPGLVGSDLACTMIILFLVELEFVSTAVLSCMDAKASGREKRLIWRFLKYDFGVRSGPRVWIMYSCLSLGSNGSMVL